MDIHILENEIIESLKMRTSSGETEREIARKAGVSPGHINHIKNQKRKATGLSIESLLKLFPSATVNLHGSGDVCNNTVSGSGNAVGHSNYVVNNPPTLNCIDSVIEVIINNDELSDEERGKFIRIIKASAKKQK